MRVLRYLVIFFFFWTIVFRRKIIGGIYDDQIK